MNIHDRFIRDTWFRKTMLELDRTEEVIREMDKRSNFVGSDTMPIRHRPDFKQALTTLHRLKKAEDEAYYQNWWQSSSSSWWQWRDSGGIPHLGHHHDNGLDTDRTEKPAKISESSIYLLNESHNEFGAKLQ